MTRNIMSRPDYVKEINKFWHYIDSSLLPSLQHRKDKRSLGEFALQIHDCTVREKFLLDQWLMSIGRGNIKVEDYGIANDGRLILNPGKNQGKPDYYLYSGSKSWKLKVKFSPTQEKATFKVCDLKNYAREDALVLLIMGNVHMIGPNGDPNSNKPLVLPPGLYWSLIGRKEIREMLKEIPIKLHWEVGGKPSIQLKKSDITKYLSPKQWGDLYGYNQEIF